MAGDWIKLRKCVLTHPRLVRTMSALKADKLRTLGGLVSVWCLLDEQTTDGKLSGYTPEILDEMVGFPGISRAMEAAGWLEISDEGLQAPEFEKHNGATAKRRAQDSVRKMSARKADICPPRRGQKPEQEKRREEKITPQPPKGGSARGAAGEKSSETDPRHHEITSAIKARFRTATGREMPFETRDTARLKTFLSGWSGTTADFWRTAEAAWKRSTDPYARGCKASCTLRGLCDNWGTIEAELAQPELKRSITGGDNHNLEHIHDTI